MPFLSEVVKSRRISYTGCLCACDKELCDVSFDGMKRRSEQTPILSQALSDLL